MILGDIEDDIGRTLVRILIEPAKHLRVHGPVGMDHRKRLVASVQHPYVSRRMDSKVNWYRPDRDLAFERKGGRIQHSQFSWCARQPEEVAVVIGRMKTIQHVQLFSDQVDAQGPHQLLGQKILGRQRHWGLRSPVPTGQLVGGAQDGTGNAERIGRAGIGTIEEDTLRDVPRLR